MRPTLTLSFPGAGPDGLVSSPSSADLSVALHLDGNAQPEMIFRDFSAIDAAAEILRNQAQIHDAKLVIDAQFRRIFADDFPAMVERMTEIIHDDLEDEGVDDNPEARADAFEEHPWANLRDALWAAEPKVRGEDCIRLEAVTDEELRTVEEATSWRVSGPGGDTVTFEDEESAAQDVGRRHRGTNLAIRLVSVDRIFECENIDQLCEDLTEAISDDIPSIEEEDARDDDFDNHPLSPIRDALVDVSPNFGGNGPEI